MHALFSDSYYSTWVSVMWDFYVCILYLLVIFSMLSEHPLLLNLLLQALHNVSFVGLFLLKQ